MDSESESDFVLFAARGSESESDRGTFAIRDGESPLLVRAYFCDRLLHHNIYTMMKREKSHGTRLFDAIRTRFGRHDREQDREVEEDLILRHSLS